ncbi:hypothetical protein [Vulgatibacter sp.]|uniref:hypothetical protein n=1 Tax=Vulgatibacter sp. TaxID=1971226 RepID=UPI0035620BF6
MIRLPQGHPAGELLRRSQLPLVQLAGALGWEGVRLDEVVLVVCTLDDEPGRAVALAMGWNGQRDGAGNDYVAALGNESVDHLFSCGAIPEEKRAPLRDALRSAFVPGSGRLMACAGGKWLVCQMLATPTSPKEVN